MTIRRFTLAALVLCVAGLVLPSPAKAQAGGTSSGSGGGSTTTTTSAERQGEIDMPIGAPQPDPVPEEDDDTPKLYDEEIPTKSDSIIYVIDISGSMDWDSRSYTGLDGSTRYGTRMERAKVELIKSIQALSRDFEFNCFAFDCDLRRWSASKQKAEPGPKASAVGWVSNLQPQGATGTGPAVASALGDKTNYTVVLLSDGDPNCGANGASGHLRMIQAANTQGAVIHCFGISCYGSFEQFMRAIASTSGGRYIPVP